MSEPEKPDYSELEAYVRKDLSTMEGIRRLYADIDRMKGVRCRLGHQHDTIDGRKFCDSMDDPEE